MKSIISSHNLKVLKEDSKNTNSKCNCINKVQCPLNGNCLAENIIYEAKITSDQRNYKESVYFGLSETTFKKRYANHLKSFNVKNYQKNTELSKEFWRIKEMKYTPKITWRIVRRCSPYNLNTKQCQLCLSEKLEIALYKGDNLLNKKTELISKCRHQNKYTLLRHDTKD